MIFLLWNESLLYCGKVVPELKNHWLLLKIQIFMRMAFVLMTTVKNTSYITIYFIHLCVCVCTYMYIWNKSFIKLYTSLLYVQHSDYFYSCLVYFIILKKTDYNLIIWFHDPLMDCHPIASKLFFIKIWSTSKT